ncbi:hypothetical protein BDV32DRAFT_123683 [Aspergillus pseudonomiae]|uniref:ER-bound oxygenase mpaB/mpaB'/Rubber oxygenase catalytic domain-containing protein n=1 Tax=Aspergillus pseudonomiae TaxID=1506151 RepID=A0A5N6HZN4_9EURO|nr:uncharacterized protein BDV37DRAFT_222696 [Aspergillus pseudonomiae]KAB8259932.1 hypothetical protein BDV32DRAFT_123683 [Aspergillus pseudonomiae]KAE8407781.1 hypothetical protein BDV37DRAFT_222696 [Aspergillus pseudonomiae]
MYKPLSCGKMSKTDDLINCQVVHSEIVTLIALQYANILVNSHPQIAQGVQNHSYFRTNPTSRIYYSLLYIQGVCGTPEERNCVSRIVNKAHRGVRGRNYNAMEPKQQLWVASCFFIATLTVQETFFGLLDEQSTEALYQDASRFGTSLQMPLEMWPESIHKFWEYWNHEIRHFEATPAVFSVARDVLYPHNLPFWIWVASPILRIFTIHWLPEAYRARYGLRTTWVTSLVYGTCVFILRWVYPLLPEFLRHCHVYYLKRELRRYVK